jgi:GAF domain-containing protein
MIHNKVRQTAAYSRHTAMQALNLPFVVVCWRRAQTPYVEKMVRQGLAQVGIWIHAPCEAYRCWHCELEQLAHLWLQVDIPSWKVSRASVKFPIAINDYTTDRRGEKRKRRGIIFWRRRLVATQGGEP